MAVTLLRKFIAATTAASLMLAVVVPPHAAGAASMSRAEYEACQARDEAGLRSAIEALTRNGLKTATNGLNYQAVVVEAWRRSGTGDVIDQRVDRSIADVRDEASWRELLKSLASREKAKELATSVAERVYRADDVKKALDDLSAAVGTEIGKRIELATADAAGPVTQCLQAFIGPRYGTAVAKSVTRDAGKAFGVDPEEAAAKVSTGEILRETSGGLTGAIILLVRRQLSNFAARIGQRLVGSILSRLVSVVAGGIGVVLIAKDIWDLRHGVMPIIQSEMKSKETYTKVQNEIAKAIEEQVKTNLDELAARTSDRVVEIWREFRRAHLKVLELAEKSETFRAFLDAQKADRLPRLDEIVSIILPSEGEDAILRRLGDGTLNQALNELPEASIDIARSTRSIGDAIAWSNLAGKSIDKVRDYELHRRSKPQDFTAAGLGRIIALGDRLAITRVSEASKAARETLFEVETDKLRKLARALSTQELEALASYMTQLDKAAADRIVQAISLTPGRMAALVAPGVRSGILSSRNQLAAVSMMLRADGIPDPTIFYTDAKLAYDGEISPRLIWEKHPLGLSLALLATLIVFLVLWRLIFGRRPRVIVQAPPVGGPKGA